MVRTAVRKAHIWGYPLLVNDLDVEQAFDFMNHIELDEANREKGSQHKCAIGST